MSYDDQRNTLIVEFNEVTGHSISTLQAMGDFALASVGFSSGSKTTTQKTYDIPYNRYLSKAPDGYSCKKNSKDKKQYCLCNQGERIVKFSSKHYNKQEDSTALVAFLQLQPSQCHSPEYKTGRSGRKEK